MAVYYAWRSSGPTGDTAEASLGDRALRLASKASERDRLLILAHVGAAKNDRRALDVVDTLVTRYASDPEGLVLGGRLVPEFRRAVMLLNRAIMLDSAAGVLPLAICRVCDALAALAYRYQWADSSALVESTLRRWIRMRPDDGAAWAGLADHLVSVGRISEAEDAQRRAAAMSGVRGNTTEQQLVLAMRSDDFDGAMRQCRSLLATIDRYEFASYRWYCTIALRMVGKFDDALALVRDGKVPGSTMIRRGTDKDETLLAILDWETGKFLEAASLFAPRRPPPTVWQIGRASCRERV